MYTVYDTPHAVRPHFIRRPPDTVIVGIGRRVSVGCDVEAKPSAVIYWNRLHSDNDVSHAVSVIHIHHVFP